MSEKVKATVFDFDGVLFERFPFQSKAFSQLIRRKPVISSYPLLPSAIPGPINRTPTNDPIGSLKEKRSFANHKGRDLRLDARDLVVTSSSTSDIYGNTGRPNKRIWVDMTWEALAQAGLAEYFTDIAFKPEGYTTMESKLEKILRLKEQYDEIDYYDDNPADALPIASVCPWLHVKIVQDLSTGILFSRVELDQFPNVERIAMRRRSLPYYLRQLIQTA